MGRLLPCTWGGGSIPRTLSPAPPNGITFLNGMGFISSKIQHEIPFYPLRPQKNHGEIMWNLHVSWINMDKSHLLASFQKRTSGGPQFTTFLEMQRFEVLKNTHLEEKYVCFTAFSLSIQKGIVCFFEQRINKIDWLYRAFWKVWSFRTIS